VKIIDPICKLASTFLKPEVIKSIGMLCTILLPVASTLSWCQYSSKVEAEEQTRLTQQQVTAVAEAYHQGTPRECPECNTTPCRNRPYR